MCQFSDPEVDVESSHIKQATALRAEERAKRHAAGKSFTAVHHGVSAHYFPSDTSTVHEHCIRGWWRDSLFNTSKELTSQLPSVSSHLESLRGAQKRMHLLARKCTQARLYPNPASTNCKSALKVQLSALEADMELSIKLHNMYSAALQIYTFPVQAVIDSLNSSGKECHCSDCSRHFEPWRADSNTEIRLEAEGLVNRLYELNQTFRNLHKDLLKKWEMTGRTGLRRMIDALPEQQDLKHKPVVRKYFPRQVKEIEEAESRTIRKPTAVGRRDSKLQGQVDGKNI